MRRLEIGEKLISCMANPVDKERCPYHQSTYGCCFEDEECMEWLGKAADELVALRKELEELRAYKDLEEQGRLLVLPCKVGDTVYEIIEETVPNRYFYISEWEVQDVSVKGIKYADEWESYDYENLYFTREEAEAELRRMRGVENAETDSVGEGI